VFGIESAALRLKTKRLPNRPRVRTSGIAWWP